MQVSAFFLAVFIATNSVGESAEREIVINKEYLRFPKRFFADPRQDAKDQRTIDFIVDNKIARRELMSLADNKPDYWAYLDVGEFKGKPVVLKIDDLPESSKALSNIYQDDTALDENGIYREQWRPQFHYTVKRGWLNACLSG